ncbi:MAG: hypothetical protein ACXW03_05690 [Methylobacter sp.]
MTPEDEAEIVKLMRENRDRRRGYADFFSWAIDRDLEEFGIVSLLSDSLAADDRLFFKNQTSRGRPNDPPDCEAQNHQGERVAIEVTELVDGEAIHKFKKAEKERIPTDWAEWTRDKFLVELQDRISAKDKCFHELKGAPYAGGYIIVVHTDEIELDRPTVLRYLDGHRFSALHISRAFLLLSYDQNVERSPYFELQLDG